MFQLDARLRRIVYVAAYEGVAILSSSLLLGALSHDDAPDALPLAVAISVIAVVWNLIFNTLFETAEARFGIRRRTVGIRVLHSLGFEGGLTLMAVPMFMVWFGVGLWDALMMEAALLIFFLIYTYVFTWVFDRIVALPHMVAETH